MELENTLTFYFSFNIFHLNINFVYFSHKKRTYHVKTIKIIEDTDWSYLQKTKDNRITLITCVANEPTKRLCVQGLEI